MRTIMTLPFTDLTVAVEFYVTPGVRGCQFQANGDPGWPDEPAECEVCSVEAAGIGIMEALSDSCIARIEESLLEDYNEY